MKSFVIAACFAVTGLFAGEKTQAPAKVEEKKVVKETKSECKECTSVALVPLTRAEKRKVALYKPVAVTTVVPVKTVTTTTVTTATCESCSSCAAHVVVKKGLFRR